MIHCTKRPENTFNDHNTVNVQAKIIIKKLKKN